VNIRILIADDHAIVRHGLARSIKQEEDMELVGQATQGHQAVELARQLAPDVAVIDISMPDLNGIEATRQISHESTQTKIIGLSMHSATRYVREMLKAGATGYLLKDCEFDELAEAIRAVADGQMYITPAVCQTVLNSCIQEAEQGKEGAFSVLTPREREVLQLMAEGYSTKQIARRLYISPKTVEAHRLKVMHKLDIDNVAQLTKYAIQEGLTSPQL
jgi:DNA-binding NarL/FixJ family response regulator